MLQTVRSSWSILLVSGLVALGLGVFMVVAPQQALQVFVLIYGVWVIVDGVFIIARSVAQRASDRSWVLGVLGGLLAIAVGVLIFAFPTQARTALLWALGLVNIVVGLTQVYAAVRLRDVIPIPWVLGINGALRMLLGVFLIARPVLAGTIFIFALGLFLVVLGVLEVWLALRVRNHPEQFEPPRPGRDDTPA